MNAAESQASQAWAVGMAIALIAFAFAAYYISAAWFTHREWLAKIQQGIDPDQPGRGPTVTELAERVLALERLQGDGKPISTDIKLSHPK